jgi:hypothetical protein
MPVSITKDPNILRVSFPVEGEGPSDRFNAEIVCFLRISEGGLETNYSHHLIRSREAPSGPYTQETTRRMSLTPTLKAVISLGAMHELWSTFPQTIRTSPGRIDSLPTDIDTRDSLAFSGMR